MGEGLSNIMRCVFRKLRTCGSGDGSNSSSASNSGGSSSNTSTNSSTGAIGIGSGNGNGNRMSSNENGGIIDKRSMHNYQTTNNTLNKNAKYLKSNPKYLNNYNHPYYYQQQLYHRYHSTSVPISICIMILICYITLGALLFHRIQNWGVLESLYFCFTSLGTIGFGELSPKGNVAQYAASAYILAGMAVVAMCFSLIQTELIMWLRKFGVQDQQQSPNQQQPQQQSHQSSASMLSSIGGNSSGTNAGGYNNFMHHNHLMHQIPPVNTAEDMALVTVSVTPKS